MGEITLVVVILLRTLIPLTILRWRLAGVLLSILADATDVMIFDKFGSGSLSGEYYHSFDKFFDIYYLSFALVVAFRFTNTLARRTAKALFVWRFVGIAAFEISTLFGVPMRQFIIIAPNIFENFYVFWVVVLRFFRRFSLTIPRLLIILLIVGIPKIIQEYLMHSLFINQTWSFFRDYVFFWLY